MQPEDRKKLRAKNLAVLAALVAFMIIVFAVTLIRLKTGMSAAGY